MLYTANVRLVRKGGSIEAGLSGVAPLDWHQSLPPGSLINSRLSDPRSDLHCQAKEFLSSREDGEIYLGQLRVFNGGGVAVFSADNLMPDLSTPFMSHDKMLDRIQSRLGSRITRITVAPVRDWGAPGSFGVIDGGGIGRGDQRIAQSSNRLRHHCYFEMLGEVGLWVLSNDGKTKLWRRATYTCDDLVDQGAINHDIEQEWHRSHDGMLPVHTTLLMVDRLPLPDRMVMNTSRLSDHDVLSNVRLAVELENASLECMLKVKVHASQAPTLLRFEDLEINSSDGRPLDRSLAVILVGEDPHHTAAVFYRNGWFDYRAPMVSIWGNDISPGNEKFDAIKELITS